VTDETKSGRTLWETVAPLLARIERPSRYSNHEFNALYKPEASYRAALLYPDTYEIGQANQAIGILYDLINGLDDCSCERAFLPWVDMLALMREQGISLFTLESMSPVRDLDLFGITMPHELAATNILEALDLAGIPLHADQRDESHPLILGGGPGAFNPEPMAEFFDAIAVGEGEEVTCEIIDVHLRARARNASRRELLEALAEIPGVYVPLLHEEGRVITKRVIQDFDACPVVTAPIVPFAEVAHDRFVIEVLRGCSRGCRFCQAGMMYRPVRERSADTIVRAVARGIACTGFDEVALSSLSTTDHSQIEQTLRRLNHQLSDTGVGISLPSQRLDAFGVDMARLVAGEKKAGLTFAPEAGTQRLRDIINKNVTEDDLISAVQQAFSAGWRRCKLYFMIGLPGETDEDIRAIAELVNRAYAAAKDAVPETKRGQVRMSVSVAVFVPKVTTPFQWVGQIARAEIERRIAVLRGTRLHKGIDLKWHDPASSLIEAALSRAGREAAALIEAAWREGARFDAWTEQFRLAAWEAAAQQVGLSLSELAEHEYALDEPLPWDHIDCGVSKEYLRAEYERALSAVTTPDCSFVGCTDCGACPMLGASVRLGGDSRG